MMTDLLFNRLRELSWRRKLTAAEEAELRRWLAAHPEAAADWEAEASLNEVLEQLPDAPVASNFTARVLAAVEREATADARREQPRRAGWSRWLNWLPKGAVAVLLAGAGVLAYERHEHTQRRWELAQSVATISEVASLPSPEILKDFDAIRALNPTPPPDEQLLKVMQ